MPYIMNFLGIIYLNYAHDNRDEKDFKITKSLFETAIKHQDLITSPLHLGCIYYHLGQLYDCGTRYMENRPGSYFKGAIEFYRQAQRYLGKYTYPYDYGYISYRLSHLFFNFGAKRRTFRLCVMPSFSCGKPKRSILMPSFRTFGPLFRANSVKCSACWGT